MALSSRIDYSMNVSNRFLEQALDELEVLRKENEVLKQKLSKALLILEKIKRLLMENRSEKK